MSDNRQWDSIQLESLNLPYDSKVRRELDVTPRIVSGLNTYVTYGGKIMKRPGTINITNTSLSSARFDRLWIYETLDNPVIVYLMASVFIGGSWALYYNRLDGTSPGWTSAGSLRQLNASTQPHEAAVSRGIFYVKGFPTRASSDTLGTVVFNGTGGTPFTTFWGIIGPTVPAHITCGNPRLNVTSINASQTSFNISKPNLYNLLTWSQDFTQAAFWTLSNITVTSGQLAPDGTITADNLTTTAVSNNFIDQPSVAFTIGTNYVFSVWLKSASPQTVTLSIGTGSIWLSQTANVTSTWTRFTGTGTATQTSSNVVIQLPNSNGVIVQAWGAQVEIGALFGSPSAYERTLGAYNLPTAAPFNIQIDYELITVTGWTPGTGAITSCLRAAQGTVAAPHNLNALILYKDWLTPPHPVTVNNSWLYSYCYVTRTGHYSNRAPLETNPDNYPSATGPTINLIPQFWVQGHPDTVNVPTIAIFRTTDGGGTFTQLATITNTGAYPIFVYDADQTSSSVAQSLGGDPTPDSALNSQLIAPTLTSNSPPPTVISKNTTLSTLTAPLFVTVTSFNVATTYNGVAISGPAAPFTITVDNEQMTVTAINYGTGAVTVNRAVNGSRQYTHALGANVVITPIVGFDNPIPSTPIASYASRLWMGLGNILFYSAQEELNLGIPEEAWPSGTFGNFYRLQFPILNLIDTTNALYVITTESIYMLTGANLETFFLQPVLHNVGGAIGHPQAVTKYRDSVVWLTNDLRVAILQGGNFRTISEALGVDYTTQISAGASIILKYWATLDKEWIVLSTSNSSTPANNRTWIYDITKSETTQQDFWSTPWSIQAAAVASGRMQESQQQRRLVFAVYDGTNTTCTRITENVNEFVGSDDLPAANGNPFDFKLVTNLWMVPPGDHVNLLRRPGLVPVIYGLVLEETVFTGVPATDPQIFYYINDLWTTPQGTAAGEQSAHDDSPLGYRTRIFPIQSKGRRVAFEFDKLGTTELFEIQDFEIIYNSDSGSGL